MTNVIEVKCVLSQHEYCNFIAGNNYKVNIDDTKFYWIDETGTGKCALDRNEYSSSLFTFYDGEGMSVFVAVKGVEDVGVEA